MMWTSQTIAVVVLLMACVGFVCGQTSSGGVVYLTVAFCPTYFTSAGAVVAVDALTGEYSVVGTFLWPESAIFGCAALYDPSVTFDPKTSNVYLDFVEDFGEVVTVNAPTASVVSSAKPKSMWFIGYENFGFDGSLLQGLSPTGTKNGEGAYQWGSLNPNTGAYVNKTNIPFKAITDDSHYVSDGIYWVQASYDTRSADERCAPSAIDDCLLAIDVETGNLINSTMANSYTVYKYAMTPNADGTILCFAYGYEQLCEHPYESYLFLNLDLSDASTEPVACIWRNTTIQDDEWISSFSSDNSLFATANAFGSELQYLTFDTTTGATLVQTNLSGLAQELHATSGLVFFWSVDFAPAGTPMHKGPPLRRWDDPHSTTN